MNRKSKKPACVFAMKKDGKIYRYMVRVYINKERHYVGCFKDEESAVIAYNKYMELQQRKSERLRNLEA